MSQMGLVVVLAVAALGLASNAAVAAVGMQPSRQIFSSGSHYLVVEALRDDLLHFELGADGHGDVVKPIYTTPMVLKTDYPGPQTFTVSGQQIDTNVLRVTVAANLCVTVFDKARNIELQTLCPTDIDSAWKTLQITSKSTRNAYGLGQYFSAENADGDWIGRVWDPQQDGFGARQRGFAGGANDYSMFPILYALGAGTECYGFFLDQVYKQMWDFRATPWTLNMWGDQIRWYVMSGADLPSLRHTYMELTGLPPVPPKRSFGLWVSEFGFLNWNEVNAELADLRSKHFPVDGFAMDLQWFGGTFGDPDHSRMGSLTWDQSNFPDAQGNIARLAQVEGVNLMTIEEPYISQTLTEYQDLGSRGYLAKDCATCGPTYLNYNPWWGRGGMLDYTNPSAGDYWHDDRRQLLVNMGITDHWADLGEPEQYNANAWYYGFPEQGKHAQADIHNMYGFSWMASIWRGYSRNHAVTRPYLLSRTGTSGIQRFGVGMWSGDIGSNWGNLASQMNAQMHMSLSGVDYYGSDAGGFQRSHGDVQNGSEALYTQWFADSAAIDVPVRPHAWNLDKLRPTAPSLRGDQASNLANLRQRYALAPYYYSLAFQAHLSGEAVFPPLVYYFQDDLRLRSLGNEKMIGPSLLVAMLADPGAVVHDVYLPRGRWIDFHAHASITSQGETFAAYPLYPDGRLSLPTFARAGAIIPMVAVDDATMNIRGRRRDGTHDSQLRFVVYADSTASSFDVYEDDDESFDYDAGKFAVTRVSQNLLGSEATIEIAATTGQYAGMATSRSLVIELIAEGQLARAVRFNGDFLSSCAVGPKKAPCYTNAERQTIIINLGEQPVVAVKDVVVSLAPANAVTTSLYLVCANGTTTPGTSVYVVGGHARLGNWQPAQAIKLAPSAYPTWAGTVDGLPANAALEWKCLKMHDDGSNLQWQTAANNTGTTGAAGAMVRASTGSF